MKDVPEICYSMGRAEGITISVNPNKHITVQRDCFGELLLSQMTEEELITQEIFLLDVKNDNSFLSSPGNCKNTPLSNLVDEMERNLLTKDWTSYFSDSTKKLISVGVLYSLMQFLSQRYNLQCFLIL